MKGSMTDPFFQIINDGHWNACVGVQGSEINYVEGYLDAARLLADMLVEQEMLGKRDTLVMPILYNARHGLELALKYAVHELQSMELVQRPEGRVHHHILRYWGHISDANVPDRVVREIVAELEAYAASLSRIDEDGQELRYFNTTDNRRSLANQSVVHLLLIRESVTRLSTMLGELTERLAVMREQHPTGTRTTRCSRLDLEEIVGMVGPHATWIQDDFLERKAEIMARFALTKKAFSNAIDAIRGSRELAAQIGIETELLHLSDDKTVWLVQQWLEVYPTQPEGDNSVLVRPRKIGLEEIERHAAAVRRLAQAVSAEMTVEEFAEAETIFYIGRNRDYGEYHNAFLEDLIRQYSLEKDRRLEKIDHVVSKINFLDGLLSGLRRVGRPSLSARLTELREQNDGLEVGRVKPGIDGDD